METFVKIRHRAVRGKRIPVFLPWLLFDGAVNSNDQTFYFFWRKIGLMILSFLNRDLKEKTDSQYLEIYLKTKRRSGLKVTDCLDQV